MKKRLMRSLVSLALVVSMLSALLAGCENKVDPTEATISTEKDTDAPKETEKATEAPKETEPEPFDPKTICEGVTLTIAVPEHTRIADWEENIQTKMIEEALGVELKFEVYPKADFNTKINTMVMGGDELPDMIFNNFGDAYLPWVEAGAILELTEFYENPNLASNINKAIEGADGYDLISYMKNADGEIYYLPGMEQSATAPWAEVLWVYEPWVEALGKELPTNLDEFQELCKLVAEKDMNGNGDTTDEIPYLGAGWNQYGVNGNYHGEWFEALMNPFVYAYDKQYLVVEDGKVGVAYDTDEWKEGLKYIKEKFFDEGLLTEDAYTTTKEGSTALLASEIPTVFAYNGQLQSLAPIEIGAGYIPVIGITGPEGEFQGAMYEPAMPTARGVITVDCENPEAAFLVCDLLCSEYFSIRTRYGEYGVHWCYWPDANDPAYDKTLNGAPAEDESTWVITSYVDKTFWSSKDTTDISWLSTGPYIRNQDYTNRRVGPIAAAEGDVTGALTLQRSNRNMYSATASKEVAREEVFDYAPLSADEQNSVLEIKTTALKYVEEMTADFLLGKKDIDKEWDAYLAELDKIGVYDMLDLYQKGYDRVH